MQSYHASRSSSWVQISRAYLLRNCDKTSLLPIRPQIICSFRVKQVDLRFPATIYDHQPGHRSSVITSACFCDMTTNLFRTLSFLSRVQSLSISIWLVPSRNMLAKHEYFNVQCPDDSIRHALTGASTCYLWNFWPSANNKAAPLSYTY